MNEVANVQETVVIEKGCDHKPMPIEFLPVYRETAPGKSEISKLVACRWACYKCEKLLPIDLAWLVLRTTPVISDQQGNS